MKYIIDNAIIENWKPAAYAQFTTFLHARDNGYKDFWNIDADDIALYAKPRRIAKMLKTVKDCANEKNFHIFSLDFWITNSGGTNWSYGVSYVDNSLNWIKLMKDNCSVEGYAEYNKKHLNPKNADKFTAYLHKSEIIKVGTYYFENLYTVHHHNDILNYPWWGIRHWADGKCYWHTLSEIFGMGENGSLEIPKEVIKLDIGFTVEEYFHRIKNISKMNIAKNFERSNHLIDSSITAIFTINNISKNVQFTLRSLSEQTFKDFRLIVTDAGLNKTALKTCREMESKFDGRMKIITGLSKENLLGAGLQAAKSRYVIFINGNDVFIPEAFQFLHNIAENTRADVVHTSNFLVPNADNTLDVKADETNWGKDFQLTIFLNRLRDKFGAWADGKISQSIFNKLIRREFLEEEKISLPFTDIMTQWTFSLQCLMLAENYVRIPQPLYVRTSQTPPPNHIKDFPAQIKSLAKCYEALDKLDDEVFYFDEYADEKNFLKNLFNKNFVNEV